MGPKFQSMRMRTNARTSGQRWRVILYELTFETTLKPGKYLESNLKIHWKKPWTYLSNKLIALLDIVTRGNIQLRVVYEICIRVYEMANVRKETKCIQHRESVKSNFQHWFRVMVCFEVQFFHPNKTAI